ncbi:MAG: hypothetical protein HY321_06170 [Armatimonadetes bacterium]|nr:hypothetical protein [Armatimonadota bacterium]
MRITNPRQRVRGLLVAATLLAGGWVLCRGGSWPGARPAATSKPPDFIHNAHMVYTP